MESFGTSACPWLDILELQSDIYYSGERRNWEEDPESPWFLVSKSGYDFIDCSEYINSIPEHPEKVLEHPDSAFILDVDNNTAKDIEESYGVICQPVSSMETLCKLTKNDSRWVLRKVVDTEGEGPLNRTCWKDLLGDSLHRYPSNSMILIDRNFFTQKNNATNEYFGVEGLKDLLESVLPKKLKCEYQILIVYQDGLHLGKYTNELDFIKAEELNINCLLQELRGYPIRVELLSIASSDRCFDYNHKQLFFRSHNRRVITNYYYLGADYTLAPFYPGKGPRAEQSIWHEYLFSRYPEREVCDLALVEKESAVSLVKDLLEEDDRYRCCVEPINNRLSQTS